MKHFNDYLKGDLQRINEATADFDDFMEFVNIFDYDDLVGTDGNIAKFFKKRLFVNLNLDDNYIDDFLFSDFGERLGILSDLRDAFSDDELLGAFYGAMFDLKFKSFNSINKSDMQSIERRMKKIRDLYGVYPTIMVDFYLWLRSIKG